MTASICCLGYFRREWLGFPAIKTPSLETVSLVQRDAFELINHNEHAVNSLFTSSMLGRFMGTSPQQRVISFPRTSGISFESGGRLPVNNGRESEYEQQPHEV